ncbi:MAG TPA: 1-deoxy-D-xylulose-5-phosphate synthase [Propionibacteriaceae bacterium]|nr:1-deoxy-D-xylulose-5-phosphate synthase [Propionibacteriaceae bacterium]
MAILDRISGPDDVRALTKVELETLVDEIRRSLIRNVSRTGGHLGPNLGIVELTVAIHKVFNSPSDPVIFDTGHQSYVHKMLTGREDRFPTLRQSGGLSGYPSRRESEHDWVENSHASTSLSWATGLAEGLHVRGESGRTVVAVIGDGALTGGMAWEALNNLSAHPELPVVVVVNDNGRSYEPTVGGLARHLSGMRTDPRYEQTLHAVKRGVRGAPLVGRPAYDLLHGLKTGVKDVLAPQGMFSDLGIKYLGPIDGHDLPALTRALEQAKGFRGPVLVHCITQKGRGFRAAEEHEEDRFHAVGRIDEFTGKSLTSSAPSWTGAFSDALVRLGERRPDIVAVTAAMLHPTGLAAFAKRFPGRAFDVGIAEQHAMTSAAGMATAGLHPVVAVYSTFLNRAFDQVLMDIALHRLGVTIVLDRAGITGPDGPSHHGMWDMSIMGLVPGLRLAAPRDAVRLTQALDAATDIDDAPTVVRFSKDSLPEPMEAVRSVHGLDIVRDTPHADVLLVAVGQFVSTALEAADRLARQGISARVVDPVWALPVSADLVDLARPYKLVVSLEDNVVVGGFGSQLRAALADAGAPGEMLTLGIPDRFIEHASRAEILDAVGLTPQGVARTVTEKYLGLADELGAELPVASQP